MKKLLIILYVAIVICMAMATIVEKYQGTAFVAHHIYGAWWFSLLWALLTAVGIVYFLKQRVRKAFAVVLHLSFVVILAGALLTHLTGTQGMMHLRIGDQADSYVVNKGQTTVSKELPYLVKLDTFRIVYHEGTTAAADYVSQLTIIDGKQVLKSEVSMNNIFSHRGTRFYQSSYDENAQGSILAVNSDPWGIPVTYTGYALLFIALLWMLVAPNGRFRRLLLVLFCFLPCMGMADEPHTFPASTAREFGKLNMLYNDRICPVQTFAIDFTKKLYGKRHYGKYTAEQVLAGFIFWGDEWSNEPILKLKGGPLRETLQLPKYCSVNTFFNPSMGYILGPYVQEYYRGNNDAFHKDVGKMDDRLQLIMELRQGKLLKIFPYTSHLAPPHPRTPAPSNVPRTTWYSPVDKYPEHIDAEQQEYMKNVFSLINEDAHAGRFDRINEYLQKMQKYQVRYGGASLPSAQRTRAERLYNAVPFATILFMVNLTMAMLLLIGFLRNTEPSSVTSHPRTLAPSSVTSPPRTPAPPHPRHHHSSFLILLASFLALTLCLILRWIVSGTIPMANGYETMLLMAWLVMLMALLMQRRFPIMLFFGFLMSGFFLLVSHISQMDPQISHVMPVLSSPLLTIHVSIIMMAYALLSMTFICGIAGLVAAVRMRHAKWENSLHTLSQLFLYPAITCLGFGIFTGAIWANISWGTYWSWDPKETWALITLMVYAVPLHDRSLPWLRKPSHYHLFMILAFLSLIMTYFGVNYFLGGMHSYA